MTGSALSQSPTKRCVCGNIDLQEFSPQYLHCSRCETLIAASEFGDSITQVSDDESGLYGREYWYSQQQQLGYPDIESRARLDLPERCSHWLATLLKYKSPPGNFLELGCAHGGFVAMAKWAGFDAVGLELSPAIAGFAERTFDIPVLTGAIEEQELPFGSYDVIALMDVLEHLPHPEATMRHCLDLLRDDGIMMVQTPRYPEGRTFQTMLAEKHPFLEQLKANQHLYLFSATSLNRLFAGLGAADIREEDAIFSHYDQFVVIGKSLLPRRSGSMTLANRAPGARLAQALVDARAAYVDAIRRWHASEADREARLHVIDDLSRKMQDAEADREARLRAVQELSSKLDAAEADREARLRALRELSLQLEESERDRAERLDVIHGVSARLQEAEADREARLAIIHDLTARLQASEAERQAVIGVADELAHRVAAAEQHLAGCRQALDQWNSSRWGRLLRAAGIPLPMLPVRGSTQT